MQIDLHIAFIEMRECSKSLTPSCLTQTEKRRGVLDGRVFGLDDSL